MRGRLAAGAWARRRVAAGLTSLAALAGLARAGNPESLELWARMDVLPVPAAIEASLVLSPIPQVRLFWTVTATLTVTNRGQNAMRITDVGKDEVDPLALLGPAAGFPPALPVDLPGGASTTFSWTYQAVNCGAVPARVSASLSADDVPLAQSMPTATVLSNAITAAGDPALLAVTVKDPRVGVDGIARITVTVYDACVPAVGVANASIAFAVVAGDGSIVSVSGPTDAAGSMSATVRTGHLAGRNAYLVWNPGLPGTTVFVEGTEMDLPSQYLSRNFIDPSRGEKLEVRVTLPAAMRLSVRVYNYAGELVRVVREADVPPGKTVWEWDGRNEQGDRVGNGTYLIPIVAGGKTQVRRVIVMSR